MFPKAVYAVDRFHVSQEFSRKMADIRVRAKKSYDSSSDEYYLLKRHPDLLNIRPGAFYTTGDGMKHEILDPKGPVQYNLHFKEKMTKYELWKRLLEIDDDLLTAWRCKNRLSSFYRLKTMSAAEEELRSMTRDPQFILYRGP